MLKSLYQLVALIAIVHLLVLVGLVGYLVATGQLDAERVQAIAAVLRGESPIQPGVATTRPSVPQTQPVPEASPVQVARALEQDEIARRLFEQRRREIEDRLNLARAIRLDVIRRQEQLEAERERFHREVLQQYQHDGFQKELELLSSVSSKKAKAILMSKQDAEVVRLLMAMDVRTGKKIIDACKTPEEMSWISRILERIQKLQEDRSARPGGTSPPGATPAGASPSAGSPPGRSS